MYLAQKVLEGTIDDLAVVDKMVFNYVNGDRAMRMLSEYTNAVWYVDENKVHFMSVLLIMHHLQFVMAMFLQILTIF